MGLQLRPPPSVPPARDPALHLFGGCLKSIIRSGWFLGETGILDQGGGDEEQGNSG